jgi:DNA repair protein RadC
MADQDVRELMKIKGLGQVKLCRIAAAFEIARRVVDQVIKELELSELSEKG